MSSHPQLTISEFCETGSGGTPSRANKAFYDGNIPWVKSGELREGVITATEEMISDLAIKESSAKIFPKGSILLAMYGATVGRMAFLGIDAATNQAVCNIRPDPERADARYVFHCLQSQIDHFLGRAAGGAQPNISQGIIRDTKIPLPPLDEQRRIAAILDKADELRRKRKHGLDLLDSLTQSVFFGMFGDLVKSRAYRRGAVSDWVADFDTGKNLAPDPDARQLDGYRVLKVSAVTKGIFLPNESKPLPVGYEPPSSHIVQEGDLLFSRANTAQLIGATAYVESAYPKLVLPDKIWRFVWRETDMPNPRFIHALFSTPSFRRELTKRATGTSGSMKNISKPKVLGIEIALPSREQQDEFAARYLVIQRNLASAVMQSARLEDQFSSLQSRAFSGQL